MYPERSAVQFASLVGSPLCCPADNSSITGLHSSSSLTLQGENRSLLRTWPEFGAYRDVCFYFKYFLCAHPSVEPSEVEYYPSGSARLSWMYRGIMKIGADPLRC